jgi:16S rRNA (guanine966-N2)-methyltransferase
VLRIAGGSLRGRKLAGPKGLEFRPTTARIKEFVFFVYRERIPESRFLDLFAGTGSFGLEALSRGAREGVFVERFPRSLHILGRNIDACGFNRQASVMNEDVFSALDRMGRRGEVFDLIFADPPFRESLRARIAASVGSNRLLGIDGLLILEHDMRDPDAEAGNLILVRQKRFGDCVVSVYSPNGEESR